MRTLPVVILCLALPIAGMCAAGPVPAPASFVRNSDGSWSIHSARYTALVNSAGYLSSFKVGPLELFGQPFTYQPGARLVADSSGAVGDTLSVHLKGTGEATIDYQARPDGITITPTWKSGGYAEFSITASQSLLGIELLNDKRPLTSGDSVRFCDQGEVRGLPAVSSSSNQMVRFHLPGICLHAYVQAWGAPFNYESAGTVKGYTWGRPLLASGQAFPIVLSLQPSHDKATLPAVAFVPRTSQVASLYYAGEPCAWSVDLGTRKNWQYLFDAGVRQLNVQWSLFDVHGVAAGAGRASVALGPGSATLSVPVVLRPPGSGYYQALFRLWDPGGKMLPSSFLTRFTVIHRVAGMVNRDDSLAGKSISDYAVMGMIGTGCIRESHNIGDFFSNQPQQGAGWAPVIGANPAVWMNTRQLDDLCASASEEAARYHLNWLFQANSRPAYATPAVYEAMAYALVSHCKDRVHVWEVENEPNFGYSPDGYVNECLIPFAKGVKRSDPSCTVMGPACVSVKQTLEFMQKIYELGANRYLDAISTHTYPGPGESWEQFGITTELEELRQWMKGHDEAAKPLWQTEQGYRWDLSPQDQAARYTVRQFLDGWRLGIQPDHQYYFYPQSHGFEDWYLQGGGEAGSENSWLPSAAALRFLAENTHGMSFEGDIQSPYKGIYLARFTGADGDVVAAWTFDFPFKLLFRAPGLTRMVDWMGNPIDTGRKQALVSAPLSGEPVYIHLVRGSVFQVVSPPFGPNLAAASAGAVASASSASDGNLASLANDGNWQLWEDVPGIKGRTYWQSGQKDPTAARPDWLQATFGSARRIDRVIALCFLPAVNPSPRDYLVQVERNGRWKTVGAGASQFTWVIDAEFKPVVADAVRLVVTGIDDGWQADRRWMSVLMGPKATNYTDSKMRVSELEAYGPPASGH
jgi:hypothetical protein